MDEKGRSPEKVYFAFSFGLMLDTLVFSSSKELVGLGAFESDGRCGQARHGKPRKGGKSLQNVLSSRRSRGASAV